MQELKFRKKRKRRRRAGSPAKKPGLHFEESRTSVNLREKRAGQVSKGRALIWGLEIALVCALAAMLVWFFGQRVSNAGDSMKPVLNNGDVVLVNRMVYNAVKPGRGDIIAFRPGGNENVHYSIKRIVGLPGETVQIQDGKVYIDGEELTKDIYVSDVEYEGIAEQPVELGEGEYFVMGDNQAGSDDSRMPDIGNVSREDIYGKVWFVANFGSNFGFVKD